MSWDEMTHIEYGLEFAVEAIEENAYRLKRLDPTAYAQRLTALRTRILQAGFLLGDALNETDRLIIEAEQETLV